jgi:hypothetical protein
MEGKAAGLNFPEHGAGCGPGQEGRETDTMGTSRKDRPEASRLACFAENT